MSHLPDQIVACPDCDLLQRIPAIPAGGKASCPRCGYIIATNKPYCLDRTLALTVAAAIITIIANATPLMGISAAGRHVSTTIIGGVVEMWLQGQEITALLVGFCAVVAPTAYIGFMLTLLLAVRQSPAPSWIATLMRLLESCQLWSMVEVMMLGILVSLIKIAELATLFLGEGIFAVGALVVLITAMTVNFEPREVWTRIRWVDMGRVGS